MKQGSHPLGKRLGRLAPTLTLLAWAACGPAAGPAPILVISGPDEFVSFEIRTESGEAIWRIEASEPTGVPVFVYGLTPEGFDQIRPQGEPPRRLELGEPLLIESRTTGRVFYHRGYADSDETIAIQEWSMRRLDGADEAKPAD